jgi:hypothetical protein
MVGDERERRSSRLSSALALVEAEDFADRVDRGSGSSARLNEVVLGAGSRTEGPA